MSLFDNINDYDAVKSLLESHADPNSLSPDDLQRTPLYFASQLPIVQLLLDYNANIEHRDDNGVTPILYHSNGYIIDCLIDSKANPCTYDHYGNSILFNDITYNYDIDENTITQGESKKVAEASQKLSKLYQRLVLHNIDPNHTNMHNFTPLHLVDDGNIAQYLINIQCDVNKPGHNGWTPLFQVSNIDIAKILLDNHADPCIKDDYGDDAVYYSKNDEIKTLLIEAQKNQRGQI